MSIRVAQNTTTSLSGTAFGTLNTDYYDKFIITTTGAATATLPNGYNGNIVYILLLVDGGDLVVTGDFQTGTTATFADALDSITLIWVNGTGWCTVSNQGAVAFT